VPGTASARHPPPARTPRSSNEQLSVAQERRDLIDEPLRLPGRQRSAMLRPHRAAAGPGAGTLCAASAATGRHRCRPAAPSAPPRGGTTCSVGVSSSAIARASQLSRWHVRPEDLPPVVADREEGPAAAGGIDVPTDQPIALEPRERPGDRLGLEPLGGHELAGAHRPATLEWTRTLERSSVSQWSRARARRPRRRAQRRATPCSSSRDPDRRAALARLTLGDLGTAAGLGRPARRDPRGSRSGERHHDGMRPDEDEVAVDEVGVGRWTEARGRCLRIDIAEWQAAFCTRNVNDLVVCQPTREFFWWPAS